MAFGGQEAFDAAIAMMLGSSRGWRLADIRERLGELSSRSLAAAHMGVSIIYRS